MDPDPSLKQTRLRAGLRLSDVASEAGCSIGMVSMVENGYTPTASKTRERIALAVGASLGSFWPEVTA